jgi:hypothetical protein
MDVSTAVPCQVEDKSVKWETLVHNGVLFPPEYTPHGVKMLYDGQVVDLTSAQEEVRRAATAKVSLNLIFLRPARSISVVCGALAAQCEACFPAAWCVIKELKGCTHARMFLLLCIA